jgi:glucose/arabinose dehydrogenase
MTNNARRRFRMMALVAALLLVSPILGSAPEASAADVVDTVGLVDPDTGIWRLRSETGSIATFFFGDPGDVPFAGDWDCDGIDTPGLYRQSDGYVYLRNTNTQGIADVSFFFGNPGDVPLPGDFNGDGCDTVSIYRPSESRVYIINTLGDADEGLGSADYDFVFGNPGDTPFTGDFNADGTDTVGLYRETTGLTYMRLSNTQGNADLEFFFGDPADRFVGGDWDGDGTDSPGVYRPSDSRFHLKNTNTQGNADVSFPFGSGSWLPIAGRWGDIVTVPPLALELVASGLSQPLFLDAPTGDERLFVAEKEGRIRIIDNGVVLPTPFLQINGISTGGERGLLGMAFHPDFGVNGRFFVHYTDASGTSRVVEYFAAAGADVADPSPVRTLLTVGQPESNHNGGMIEFGPDDRLFVSLGDGGGSPGNRPSDTNDLLGSILRLDVDATAPNNGAPGNPYQGAQGDDRIWAIGVRNPWRTSIDRASGTFIVADVGQDRREEVNVVPLGLGGLDYGWPSMEGSLCYPEGSSCSSAGKVLPVVEYTHAEGRSITGGYVYRGAEIPELVGRYFYGDFITGFIRSFEIVGTSAVNHLDHTLELGTVSALSSFGTDGSGELYVLSLGGNVYRITRSG